MKKVFLAIAALATVFVGCTPEEEINKPAVSFETAAPAVDDATATFTVLVSGYTGTEPLTNKAFFSTSTATTVRFKVVTCS